jgi:hypothetical protein
MTEVSQGSVEPRGSDSNAGGTAKNHWDQSSDGLPIELNLKWLRPQVNEIGQSSVEISTARYAVPSVQSPIRSQIVCPENSGSKLSTARISRVESEDFGLGQSGQQRI